MALHDVSSPDSGGWQTYTPLLTASTTDPTLGSGSVQEGHYVIIGALVIVNVTVQFGTSGAAAGSGTYFFSLPVNVHSDFGSFHRMGFGQLTDSSGGPDRREATVLRSSAGADRAMLHYQAGAGEVTHAAPWAWANSDAVSFTAIYKAA